MNPVDPARLSTAERLGLVAGLLARGVIRLRARKSSGLSAATGESPLDLSAGESGHPTRR